MPVLLEAGPEAHTETDPQTGPKTGTDAAFLRIVDELTRRGFLGGLLGTAALAGVAGCGSDDRPAASSTPATRVVDSAYGKVAVPTQPRRVVCVDTYTISALLDVGYTPVGVGGDGADFMLARYRGSYEKLPKVATFDEVDLEAVATLAPDLILGVDYPYIAKVRTKLAAIAPTVIFPWATSGAWVPMATAATALVGKAGPEDSLERDYHAKTAQIRSAYADVLGTTEFALVSAGGGQAYVWLPGSGVAQVLAGAGVRLDRASSGAAVDASRSDQSSGFKAISYERLGVLSDAGAIITVAAPDGGLDKDGRQLTTEPTFRGLPAARKGLVAPLVNFFPFSYGQAIAALNELTVFLDRIRRTR